MRKFNLVDGKFSPEDAELAVQEVVAEHRLEGIYMTDDEISKLRDLANDRITEEEYNAWIRERAGV